MALTCLRLLSMHTSAENNNVITIAIVDSCTFKNWAEEQMKSLVDKIEATQP